MCTGSILSHPVLAQKLFPCQRQWSLLHLPLSRESVCSNQCVCLEASHEHQAKFTGDRAMQNTSKYVANGRDEVIHNLCASKKMVPVANLWFSQLTCWLLLIQAIPSFVLVSSECSQSKPQCCSSRLLKCSPASMEETNQSWKTGGLEVPHYLHGSRCVWSMIRWTYHKGKRRYQRKACPEPKMQLFRSRPYPEFTAKARSI